MRVHEFESCFAILIISQGKHHLKVIFINKVRPRLVCNSYSNFEILFVKVKNEVMADCLRLHGINGVSFSVRDHHLESIHCEGRY